MSEVPPLRLVDPSTGELHTECPECAAAAEDVENITRELRKSLRRERELREDRERAARLDPSREKVERVFAHWQATCRHPRAKLDAARYFQLLPFVEDEEHYGEAICLRAIDGAAHDPYTRKRKNGSTKRFDDLELIFRDSAHVEDFANRAPLP